MKESTIFIFKRHNTHVGLGKTPRSKLYLLIAVITVFINKSNDGSLENRKSLTDYLFHINIYKFNNPVGLYIQHSPL